MQEQSSRFTPRNRSAATVAAVLGVAVFGVGAGFAVSGCGSDNNSANIDTNDVRLQSQSSSVQSQAQSVQSQVSTAKSGGGYGY
jgi:hypothetical protein